MRFGKIIAAIIGVPMTIAGLAMVVAGGIALAVPDDNGWISAGPLRMRTEAVGFVGDDLHVDVGNHIGDGRTSIGWDIAPARIEVDSRNGKDVFVGVASTADARAYLAGIAIDRVETFHHDPALHRLPGAASVAPPTDQDFWIATGSSGEVEWSLTDGDWSVVVLNADGSSGVDVAVTGSAHVPFLGVIGVILIALGTIGAVVGSLLTYLGVRRVRSTAPSPQAAPPAEPAPIG